MDTCSVAVYRQISNPTDWQQHDFHSHNEYEIYLFHSGNCNYLIHNKVYHLQKNDLLLMNGLTLHRANPRAPTPYERSVIQFSPEILQSIVGMMNAPELLSPFTKFNNFLFRGIDEDLLGNIKSSMKEIALLQANNKRIIEGKSEETARLLDARIQASLLRLLFYIYDMTKHYRHHQPLQESEKGQHVTRMIAWMDEHFDEEVSLDKMAEDLNVSKYYMSHLFKEVTGGTIMKYLMGCRVNKAKRLLVTNTTMTALEVAIESGFKHSSHFSRFFLQKVGVTPTEFRARHAHRNVPQIMKNGRRFN